MTVKLELTPDLEASLAAQADAAGLSLEAYVAQVLRDKSKTVPSPVTGSTAKARAFERWAHSHPQIPTLPDEAFRRESLIRDAR
jgi:hypothetical protein